VLLAAAPAVGTALEPRYDHRDAHGPVVEILTSYDTVVVSGVTTDAWRPALRAGWGVDVTGEGGELVVSADLALREWSDPGRDHVLLSASARYRSYFGTEEWKTWFEAGLWLPILSRPGAGPLVGLGAIHDFSQDLGVFAGGEFATAFGEGRTVSFAVVAGLQVRFALP
jgi:hypothetical protein